MVLLGERGGVMFMFANTKRAAFVQRWLVFGICVLLWQWTASVAANVFFPTPLAILTTARQLWLDGPASHLFVGSGVSQDILPSIGRLAGGWAVASVAGIVIGITLGLVPVLADYASAVLAFMRAVPPVMLVPVFLVLFHVGTSMQLATIVFGSIWPVLLNSIDGARSVDAVKVDTARVYKTGRLRWIVSVVLPAAAPKIFAGLRINLAFALILMVVSELVGSPDGLGFRITSAEDTFDYKTMWAGIAVVSLLGYLLNRLLVAVEDRALAWHHSSARLLEG
jgi:ABC-type nitrate/sulfonate/bicarbonate transport system permease component